MKKTTQIHIYLNLQTILLLENKAYELGLTANQYIKHLILKDIDSEAENNRQQAQYNSYIKKIRESSEDIKRR